MPQHINPSPSLDKAVTDHVWRFITAKANHRGSRRLNPKHWPSARRVHAEELERSLWPDANVPFERLFIHGNGALIPVWRGNLHGLGRNEKIERKLAHLMALYQFEALFFLGIGLMSA